MSGVRGQHGTSRQCLPANRVTHHEPVPRNASLVGAPEGGVIPEMTDSLATLRDLPRLQLAQLPMPWNQCRAKARHWYLCRINRNTDHISFRSVCLWLASARIRVMSEKNIGSLRPRQVSCQSGDPADADSR
jgi:hypothetical protein